MASYSFASGGRAVLSSPVITAVPFSVAGWARPATLTAVRTMFYLGVPTASNNDAHRLGNDASGNLTAVTRNAAGTTAGSAVSASAMTASTWHHCGGVWASTSSRKSYLNGVEATNATSVTVTTPATEMDLGASATDTGYGNNFDGQLESWAVWNAVLTALEMAALAAGVLPTRIQPAALVHWWRNIGASGVTVMQDVMGRGALTITNGSSSSEVPLLRPRRLMPANSYAPTIVSARPRLVLLGF